MIVRGKEFDDIYDLVAVRVIVDTELTATGCWVLCMDAGHLCPGVQGLHCLTQVQLLPLTTHHRDWPQR